MQTIILGRMTYIRQMLLFPLINFKTRIEMKKILLAFLVLLILFLAWYGESRKFFCLGNGRCITVWKTYNNTCYIIPGKYYGLIKPSSHSYLKTTNTNTLDIIWEANLNSIIVNADDKSFTVNNFPKSIQIVRYDLNKKNNDSLFTYFDGKYNRYKRNVNYISLFIQENYAIDKDGRKL
jgi:hypothetical protein